MKPEKPIVEKQGGREAVADKEVQRENIGSMLNSMIYKEI